MNRNGRRSDNMEIVWIILTGLVAFPIVFYGSFFLFHRVMLKIEKRSLVPNGRLVEINGHYCHVLSIGQKKRKTDATIVLLSGSGVASPIYDYKILYSKLMTKYKIIVIEKFGYGYSDHTNHPKSLPDLVRQNRMILEEIQEKGPFVLMPHSMGALEALYWTIHYPEEIAGIIGLDMAVPERYHHYEKRLKKLRFFRIMCFFGMQRIRAFFPVSRRGLTDEEWKQHVILSARNALDNDVFLESMTVCDNAKVVEDSLLPDLPILMFTTDLNRGSGYQSWVDAQTHFAKKQNHCEQLLLHSGHNLHYEKSDFIVEKINNFMERIHSSS